MSIASVTTDISMGPYRIPSNAQNMVMNTFALRKNKKIEIVIPEPIFSDKFATTQWLHEEFCFTDIFLCTIYQLPKLETDIQKLFENLSSVEIYFAIEGINGKGVKFLEDCFKERDLFAQMDVIPESDSNWPDLYQRLKKSSG
jgi:sporadic carbohydrate cluster protein (TIGR04323 family)